MAVGFKEEHQVEPGGDFALVPEGKQILKIMKMAQKKKGNKTDPTAPLSVSFKHENGGMIFNNYAMNPKASYYDQAQKALYALLRFGAALEPDDDGVYDEQEAVGKFVVATVVHNPDKNDDEKIYANISYVEGNAKGFDDKGALKSKPKDDKGDVDTESVDDEDDPWA